MIYLIELLINTATPTGAALLVYFLLHREIDKLKDCIQQKHNRNSKAITYMMGKFGIKPSDIE